MSAGERHAQAVGPGGVRPRVAVVGAGAAGISAAFWLRRAGADPVVLEASDHVGGRARTVHRDGYGFDVGAGALASTGTHVRRLMRALDVTGEVEDRGVVVGVTDGARVHRVARRRPWTLLSFGALGGRSKLSLARLALDVGRAYRLLDDEDLSTAAPLDTETVSDYLRRRYPAEVEERLLGAFVRGKFLVEPEQASVVDLFAVVKAFLVADHLWTHPDGVGFFIDRAAGRLDVRLGTRVRTVRERADGVQVEWTVEGTDDSGTFDGCVLALTAKDVLAVHPGLDADRRAYLEQLDYSTSLVVQLGVARAPDEQAAVVLVPQELMPDLPAVGLGHRLAPGRAPAGHGVLTAFWTSAWSRRHWEDDDRELVDRTTAAIGRLFPEWPLDVRAWHVARWESAMVASRVGTFRDLRTWMDRARQDRRIQVAGDFLAQTSVNASVAAGETMAGRVLAAVRG